MATIQALTQEAVALGLSRQEAQWVLGEALGCTRSWMIAHDQDLLPADAVQRAREWLHARADDVPLAYLSGHKEFHGHRFAVSPAVLVPRPDTETLVDWALALLAGPLAELAQPQAIDLGTGSGAIAISVKKACPRMAMQAVDLSPDALAVARRNAQDLQAEVIFHQGSWWQPVPALPRFDLVLSNPPYIAGEDPHLPALRHEPRLALTPEGDGLDAYRALVAGLPSRLSPGAWVLFEHGHDQGQDLRALLQQAGLSHVETRQDLGGNDRVTGGQWAG